MRDACSRLRYTIFGEVCPSSPSLTAAAAVLVALALRSGRALPGRPDVQGRHPLPEIRPRQRIDLDRPRGPQGAHRRLQRLVPRRLEEREARQDRVRPPLRAPHVQRQRELQRRLLQAHAEGRRDRPQRHDQRGPDELLRERPGLGPRPRPVDGVGPDGPPQGGHHPGQARRAARRRPERAPPILQRALRHHRGPHRQGHVPAGASLLLVGRRLDRRSHERQARGLSAVVLDLLRPEQRRHRHRRRHRRQDGPREGQEVLRRHPALAARRPADGLDRQDDRDPPRGRPGPRRPGPDLQVLERARLGHRVRRQARPRELHPGRRQDLPPLQAPHLRRPDRQLGQLLHQHPRDRRAVRHPGRRQARRRAGQGRASHQRGAGQVPQGRPDRGRARAGQDPGPGPLHPGHRAHRRLRRQVRHPGLQHDLRRVARRLQEDPPAHRGRHGGVRQGERQSLALRRRLHPRGHPVPGPQGRPGRRRPEDHAGGRPRAAGHVPGRPAGHALQRAEGPAGRAPQHPRRPFLPDCSTPATPPTRAASRARPPWP